MTNRFWIYALFDEKQTSSSLRTSVCIPQVTSKAERKSRDLRSNIAKGMISICLKTFCYGNIWKYVFLQPRPTQLRFTKYKKSKNQNIALIWMNRMLIQDFAYLAFWQQTAEACINPTSLSKRDRISSRQRSGMWLSYWVDFWCCSCCTVHEFAQYELIFHSCPTHTCQEPLLVR